MNDDDALARLRRLDPAAGDRYTAADEERLQRILAMPIATATREVPRGPRPGRRRVVAATAAVTASAVLAAAAWVALRPEEAPDRLTVACHRTAEVRGDVEAVLSEGDAVESCVHLWVDGTFARGDVPPLTACVGDGGVAEVFPARGDICDRLGLPPLAASAEPDPARAILDALVPVLGVHCYDRDAAVAEVERVLAGLCLDDWSVTVTGRFTEEMPCAAFGIDSPARVVFLGGRRDSGDQGLVPPSAPVEP